MTKSSTHNLSDAHRKTAPKAAGKARVTNGKTAPKVAVGSRDVAPGRTPKVAAGARDAAPKPAPTGTTEKAGDRQLGLQVPSSMQALAERNVTQAREVYERSKNRLHAVLEFGEIL